MIHVHCTYVYMCVYYLSLYVTLQGAVAKHIIVQLLVLYIDIDTNTKYLSIADWISGLKMLSLVTILLLCHFNSISHDYMITYNRPIPLSVLVI